MLFLTCYNLLLHVVLLSLLCCCCASPVPSTQRLDSSNPAKPTVTMRELKMADYLQKFGYIDRQLSLADMKVSDFIVMCSKALRAFQNYHDLPESGEFDAATEEEMKEPRCFNDDDDILQLVKDRQTKQSSTDGGSNSSDFDELRAIKSVWPDGATSPLTYSVKDIPSSLSRTKVLHNIKQAIEEWADNSGLKVNLVSEGGDIEMTFAPLDEEWEVLGRGYYPQRGLVIFDSLEDWKLDSGSAATGPHLRKVALHEVGHALGLTHSDNRNTIMYPRYSPTLDGLTFDDLKAIQEAYGKPEEKTTSQTSKSATATRPLGQGTKHRLEILHNEPKTSLNMQTFTEMTVSEEINQQENLEIINKENGKEEEVFRDEREHSQGSSSRITNRDGEVSTEVLERPRLFVTKQKMLLQRHSEISSGSKQRTESAEIREHSEEETNSMNSQSETISSEASSEEMRSLEASSEDVGSPDASSEEEWSPEASSKEERSALVNPEEERSALVNPEEERSAMVSSEEDRSAVVSLEEDKLAEVSSEQERSAQTSSEAEWSSEASSAEDTKEIDNGANRDKHSGEKSDQTNSGEEEEAVSERVGFAKSAFSIESVESTDDGAVQPQSSQRHNSRKDSTEAVLESHEIRESNDIIQSGGSNRLVDIDAASTAHHGPAVPFQTRATSSIESVRNLSPGRLTGAVSKMPLQRFVLVGKWNGVEVVDTLPNTRMTFAESLLWSSKDSIEANAESKVKEPVKMTLVGENVLIVDKSEHCILQLTVTGIKSLAGRCGDPGYRGGNLLSAQFKEPVDMCKGSQGSLLVLDQGNSKIRLVEADSGVVSTFYSLPTNTLFTSMSCKEGLAYLSANTDTESQIYKLDLRDAKRYQALTKIAGVARGRHGRDGLTRSDRGSAEAFGEFNSVSCTEELLYLQDGRVLRELDLVGGNLDTVCGESDQFFIGEAGDCSITALAGTERVDDIIFGLDSKHNKLFTIKSSSVAETNDPFEDFFSFFV